MVQIRLYTCISLFERTFKETFELLKEVHTRPIPYLSSSFLLYTPNFLPHHFFFHLLLCVSISLCGLYSLSLFSPFQSPVFLHLLNISFSVSSRPSLTLASLHDRPVLHLYFLLSTLDYMLLLFQLPFVLLLPFSCCPHISQLCPFLLLPVPRWLHFPFLPFRSHFLHPTVCPRFCPPA